MHHILQRIGLDAFALAANFQSVDDMMKSTGARVFVRISMQVQLDAEQNPRKEDM